MFIRDRHCDKVQHATDPLGVGLPHSPRGIRRLHRAAASRIVTTSSVVDYLSEISGADHTADAAHGGNPFYPRTPPRVAAVGTLSRLAGFPAEGNPRDASMTSTCVMSGQRRRRSQQRPRPPPSCQAFALLEALDRDDASGAS